jgi:hypothetical protein
MVLCVTLTKRRRSAPSIRPAKIAKLQVAGKEALYTTQLTQSKRKAVLARISFKLPHDQKF